jgi:HTH-type transcriptional regulator, sugar sensing transcriptional regulator
MTDAGPIALLRSLGLNQLESEVYLTLLAHEPMTPYRVGTILGRPTANVYKAVESLARRGAVLIEEGESRTCRAVPVAEFIRELERDFLSTTRDAAAALARISSPPPDERVYRLTSVAQVLERANEMIDRRSQSILVVDAFPRILAELLPAIRRAVRRKVRVFVQAYEAVSIDGASVAVTPVGAESIRHWKSEQLNLVADGREQLLALVSSDLRSVYQAIWSQSVYLSCILHAGRVSEHTIQRLMTLRQRRKLPKSVTDILDEHPFFINSDVPGQKELIARFSGSEEPA